VAERDKLLAAAISALASARGEEREAAADTIFGSACAEAAPFVEIWARDAEFAGLIGAPAAAITAGVAVEREHFDAIRGANGSPRLSDVPRDQDVLEFQLKFGAETRLEILTTNDPFGNGAVARYLKKFGSNIQHVEIATSDVDRATEILRTRFAIQPVYPAARAGGDGSRINFFLVERSAGKKLLIELEQEPPRS
jgi:hypothetical protein